ncbi:unnamed protein product [Spirodela intermedia]|uniref:Uncharacterized protein n=1 Tax=Spirodela intermedia TaxID=51605 RepID=A0A7I8JVX3_SPIIN|nr:unnamed protein product [Spirodela intermedia]
MEVDLYHVVTGNSGTPPGGDLLSASSSSSPAAANPPAAGGTPSWERTYETKSAAAAAATNSAYEREIYENPLLPYSRLEGGSSYGTFGETGGREGSPSPSDLEHMKAKITAHPRYSTLVEAYIECQKVGATPRVAARLAAVAGELGTQQRAARCFHDAPSVDPELSQFMEAYCNVLVMYREELKRPLQEAMDFLRRAEAQLNELSAGSPWLFSDSWSSEEDGDACGRGRELAEDRQQAMGRDLKNNLLKRYGEHLCSLKQELSKKKNKKGKLPKEARQKLLIWWELHYSWPYPSESEKAALEESTGLTQNQISNWFINQRKRHWKPSEDARPGVGEGRAAAVYMAGQSFPGDGRYRAGP